MKMATRVLRGCCYKSLEALSFFDRVKTNNGIRMLNSKVNSTNFSPVI